MNDEQRYLIAVDAVLRQTEATRRVLLRRERLPHGVPFRFVRQGRSLTVAGPQCVTVTLQIRDEDLSKIEALGDRFAMRAGSQFARVYRDLALIRVEFTLPKSEWREVKLSGLLHRRESATIGQVSVGPAARIDWQTPHKAIFGTTQSGKTTCIQDIVLSLARSHTPDDYRFLILNPKNDPKLQPFARLRHLAAPVATDYEEGANLLRFALGQMEKRRQNHALIQQRLVVVVDEIAQLTEVMPETGPMVTQLSQLAGGLNINLVVASQAANPRVFGKNGSLAQANFPSRLVFQLPNAQAWLATGIKGQETARLGGDGDGLAVIDGGRVTRFRAAWPADEDMVGLLSEDEPAAPAAEDLAGDRAIEPVVDRPEADPIDFKAAIDKMAYAVVYPNGKTGKPPASATAIRQQFGGATAQASLIRDMTKHFMRRVKYWRQVRNSELLEAGL